MAQSTKLADNLRYLKKRSYFVGGQRLAHSLAPPNNKANSARRLLCVMFHANCCKSRALPRPTANIDICTMRKGVHSEPKPHEITRKIKNFTSCRHAARGWVGFLISILLCIKYKLFFSQKLEFSGASRRRRGFKGGE